MHTTKKFVGLHYTNEEWEILERLSKQKTNGKLAFSGYLYNRLAQLGRTIKPNIPDDIQEEKKCLRCNKKKGRFLIPPDVCNELLFLSNKHCIPLAALVNRIIVSPLFNEFREDNA